MKRLVLLLVPLIVAGAGACVLLNRADTSDGVSPALSGAPAEAPLLARGEYLTRAADCFACHTVPGGAPFAGGVAFKLPFGTIYSSNITADIATGIGSWSDVEFLRALHDGVRKDGARLYPAFPYTSYTLLSRRDALAIKTYLLSLPAVSQPNRANDLAFPFNQRWALGFWNAAFFKNARFTPDAARSTQWNSGAYLATALGHCAECHTPRNIGFAMEHGNELAGASLQGWRAPNITADPSHGIGAWSDAEVASYLVSGHADGRGSAAGPMGEAVEHSLQYLAPEDAAALVAYLRSVPAREGERPVDIDAKPAPVLASSATSPPLTTPAEREDGLKLFESACASCHQWNGQGQQTPHASLLGLRSVNDAGGDNVTQMILHGVNIRVRDVDVFMPAFGASYSDTEVAALANYVIGHFGGKRGTVTPERVAERRRK